MRTLYVPRLIPSGPPLEYLVRVCEVLNNESRNPALHAALALLVSGWKRSGPNLKRMLSDGPDQWAWRSDCLERDIGDSFTAVYVPSETGAAYLSLRENFPERFLGERGRFGARPISPYAEALALFVGFTLNRNCERLGGPCSRCHKYYIKKTTRQKVYCSRRCGSFLTAEMATRKRYAEERQRKMAGAKYWISKCPRNRLNNWKVWVAKKAKTTPKFLTRAVNKGELHAPACVINK